MSTDDQQNPWHTSGAAAAATASPAKRAATRAINLTGPEPELNLSGPDDVLEPGDGPNMALLPRADLPAVFAAHIGQLAAIKAEAALIKVTSIDDAEGMAKAYAFQKACAKMRTGVEKKRVELKAGFLEAGRAVDAYAKDAQRQIAEVEEYCEYQALFGERHRQLLGQERMLALREQGVPILVGPAELAALTPEAFATQLQEAKDYRAYQDKLAADREAAEAKRAEEEAAAARRQQEEAAAQKAAQEAEWKKVHAALAAERAERQREQEAAEAREAELARERARIEAERAAERQAIERQIAEDRAAQARMLEEERRIVREEAERQRAERDAALAVAEAQRKKDEATRAQLQAKLDAAKKAEEDRLAAEAEAARKAASAPDREKMFRFAEQIARIQPPDLSADCAKQVEDIRMQLAKFASWVGGMANKL